MFWFCSGWNLDRNMLRSWSFSFQVCPEVLLALKMYYCLNLVLDYLIYQINNRKAHVSLKLKKVQIYEDIWGGNTPKYSLLQTLVMCFIQTFCWRTCFFYVYLLCLESAQWFTFFTVHLWKHCSFHTILYCCEHLLIVYWAFRSIWISTEQVLMIRPVWYWWVMSGPLFRPVLLDTDSDQTVVLSFILTFSLLKLLLFLKKQHV